MKRRDFITLLGGAAAAWPLAAQAQQKPARIGYLAAVAPSATPELLTALRDGLRERGHIEGQNLFVEYRWSEPPSEAFAAEFVRLNVDVIVAWGTPAVAAARRVTSNIPIIMVGVADPFTPGFAASLAQPGGNITGTTNIARDLGGKLIEILMEIAPETKRIAVLRNPLNPASTIMLREVELAAGTLGLQLDIIEIAAPDKLADAFARMTRDGVKIAIALPEPFLVGQRELIANLTTSSRVSMIFGRRENAEAGGLVSYGPSLRDQFHETAAYVDKILKGAKPADLPIQQPTKLELVINLKTAKALGIAVPPQFLARADEVIE